MFNKQLKVDIQILKNEVSDLYNKINVLIDRIEKINNDIKYSVSPLLEKGCKYLVHYNFNKDDIIIIFVVDVTESGFYNICFQSDISNKDFYKWMTKKKFLETCTILEKLKI